MRRALGGLCLVGLLALPSATGAAPPDWTNLPYYAPYSQLLITTDPSWSGAAAANLPPRLRADAPSNANFTKLRRSYIWGPTCGAAVERRTFTKSFQVPGEPLRGTFDFQYYGGRDRPYESGSLTVNGQEIAHLGKTANLQLKGPPPEVSGELSLKARKAFRYGANTVAIKVTKAALAKGARCRDDKLPRYVAVLADVFLQFGGDLRVLPPRAPLTVKQGVTNGLSVVTSNAAQFVNEGPSAAPEGSVTIAVGGPGPSLIVEATVSPSAPFSDCEANGPVLTCKYHNFLAHQRGTIQFQAGTKVNTDAFRGGAGRIETTVSIGTPSGFPDTNGLNNRAQSVVVLCATGATDPACG